MRLSENFYPHFMDKISLKPDEKTTKCILEIFANCNFLLELKSENNIFYSKIPSCSTPFIHYIIL